MNPEQTRLALPEWKKWGPYVTDRQWGTVREDYSENGAAWGFVSHDMARSKSYRWGEEGIGGLCDEEQFLCFALSFWNKKDPCLKERYFGLTQSQGNHGEDVKECYYYLDNTPTHSYMKMLYKYPQGPYPYQDLIDENSRRGKTDPEFELMDTGIFSANNYFDVFIEYAKNDPEDILINISIFNRSSQDAPLNVLPTIWFRNTWSGGYDDYKPSLSIAGKQRIDIVHKKYGRFFLYFQDNPELLFAENESNNHRLYGVKQGQGYFKDGINNYIVLGESTAINHNRYGTKASANYDIFIKSGSSSSITLRLTKQEITNPFQDFGNIFALRKQEADLYYAGIQDGITSEDARNVQRQAFAGLFWSKQFYYFNIYERVKGDPAQPLELAKRMSKIFLRDENGRRAFFGESEKMQKDPHFRDYILFYEYFHGDNGRGVGACHQTGWTALIARLLFPLQNEEKWKQWN